MDATEPVHEVWLYPSTLPRPSSRPFVGRAGELARLRAAWDGVVAGGSGVVLIGGEAGAGKTRLAAEFAGERHASGALVLSGVCDSDLTLPYQPWVMALDQLVRQLPRATLDALRDDLAHLSILVPQIERLVPGLGRPAKTEPETERQRLFGAVRALFATAASARPVVLVLDDLHWAGPQTLAVLRGLARSTPVEGLLIVGTFRDTADEMNDALTALLADLRRVESAVRIKLTGLDVNAVRELLTTVGPTGDLSELARSITQRTRGNPFFVWELCVDHREPLGEGVPDSVREVVAARLQRLSSAAREVAKTMAVASNRVPLAVLREAVGEDVDDLAAALDELVGAGVVEELPGPIPSCHYAHALLREAVSESLPALARSRRHFALAQALERVHEADRRLVLAELTYHFVGAAPVGGRDKAVYYGKRAATQARRTAAYDEAVTLLRLVLAVVPEAGSERASLLVDLGDLLARSGQLLDAASVGVEAYETATTTDDLPLRARAAIGFEQAAHVAHLHQASAQAARMLSDVLGACADRDSPLRARVRGALARAKRLVGQTDAEEIAVAALAEARRTGDTDALIVTLEAATIVMTDPHRVLALADELEQLTMGSGDIWRSMWATANRSRVLIELGELDAARAAVARHRERAMAFRFLLFRFQSEVFDAMLALADGRFEDAERSIEQADVVGSDDATLPNSGIYGLQMFMIRREQGRLDEMRPTLQVLRTLGARQSIWTPGLALASAELDLHDDARMLLHELAVDGFAAVPRDSLWPVALSFLADTCLLLDEGAHAATLLYELDHFAGRTLTAGFNACAGPADRLRAGLAEMLGDHERADALADAARALAGRARSPVWLARVEELQAWMFARRGDAVAAAERLTRARSIAASIGMGAIAAASTRPTAVGPVVALPDGLTSREAEVLALVAAGLSNRDIANRLFISPNTAANHVRSILQKTGSANRTEAATYAIRHHLDA